MNFGKISQAYEDIERQSINEADDPHLVVSVLFKELLKSMTLFVENINLKEGGDLNVKSKHFARSLTIIYGLQSSLTSKKADQSLKTFSNYMNLPDKS